MTPASLDIDRVVAETFVARVEYRQSVASTNDLAKELAGLAAHELPLLVLADQQTAGRGRGENRWWTGHGSLAFSLLLGSDTFGAGAGRSQLAGLAAAVAIVETVAPLLPAHTVGIHWPNDVYVAGRKLAGILVEVLPDRRQIVGIGLNTNNSAADAPAELRETVATLRDLSGRKHELTTILITLLKNLEHELSESSSDAGPIGARADRLCLQRGQTLALRLGQERISGRCVGIAADGGLVLDTPQGERRLYSGVMLRAA